MFVTYTMGMTEYCIKHEEQFSFPVKGVIDVKEAMGGGSKKQERIDRLMRVNLTTGCF